MLSILVLQLTPNTVRIVMLTRNVRELRFQGRLKFISRSISSRVKQTRVFFRHLRRKMQLLASWRLELRDFVLETTIFKLILGPGPNGMSDCFVRGSIIQTD